MDHLTQQCRAWSARQSNLAYQDQFAGLPLLPVLRANDEITLEIDRKLAAVAMVARTGDPAARNLLYVAFEAKLMRFVRRFGNSRWRSGRTWDRDDVAQEAFLVFAGLIDEWPGGDSFAPFFLSRFPWRLRDAVKRKLQRPLAPVTVARGARSLALVADGSAVAEEALVLLEALADSLPPVERAILLWRVRDGERPGTIAQRLGTSRRSVHRTWQALLEKLRPSFEG